LTVETVCLEVQQSYPEIENKQPEPMAEMVQRILRRTGLQVEDSQVTAEELVCDATLTIAVTGRALMAGYLSSGTSYSCYQGAEVSGQITLATADQLELTLPFSGTQEPASQVLWCMERPEHAPFGAAWPKALLKGLAAFWGLPILNSAMQDAEMLVRIAAPKAIEEMGLEAGDAIPLLVHALDDVDSAVRRVAIEQLGAIGPEARDAVPHLIDALQDVLVRLDAAEALSAITGEDFGEDADLWRQWWAEKQ
jgi:hypothetical protein